MPTQGRPEKIIPKEELENLLKLKVKISDIAKMYGVSRHNVYKNIRGHGIRYTKYSDMSQEQIELAVMVTKQEHQNAGEVMVQGHLSSHGVHVQRHKVRRAIHAVDPDGVQERKSKPIKRRTYSVPCPNYVWHIDGNHKLIRWRLVIHHGIDGFSRLVTFARCSSNNKAETAYSAFLEGVRKYGKPLRVRTDHGGENVDIWHDMVGSRGEESRPVLVGKSVHNQRIERHNRALNEQVSSRFRNEFYNLESEGILDVNNDTDMLCLHYVYLPRINKVLDEFVAAHNNHKVSTEQNRTPAQMFWCNLRLADYQHQVLPQDYHQPDLTQLIASDLPHVLVPEISNPFDDNGLQELGLLVRSIQDNKLAYRQAVQLAGQLILSG